MVSFIIIKKKKIISFYRNIVYQVCLLKLSFVLSFVTETALGMNVHAQDDVDNEYIEAVHT